MVKSPVITNSPTEKTKANNLVAKSLILRRPATNNLSAKKTQMSTMSQEKLRQ